MGTKKCCGGKHKATVNGNGVFYCPMNCEGKKVYMALDDCPVCGMDLIEQANLSASEENNSSEHKAYKILIKKMKVALGFSLAVFIISMGDLILGQAFSQIFSQSALAWMQFFLSLPVIFYSGWGLFVKAYRSVLTKNLNMFTLVGIGTGVAFIFSLIATLFPDIFPAEFKNSQGGVHLYFEATVVILTLVLLGQLLEAKAHKKTGSALKKLLKLSPSTAVLFVDDKDQVVSIDKIIVGDVLRVKAGEQIPVDGVIIKGQSSIDESMISGEAIFVDKKIDDKVKAGSINGDQAFVMRAQKVGADTLLSKIIKMLNQASRSQAPVQKLADRVAKYFVPIVILSSVLTFFLWINFGPNPVFTYAFVNAIAVLIIACPCALGLATPMSIMVGVGKAAQMGVLVKNAEALEAMSKVNVLIIDKTGTITEGKASVKKLQIVDSTFNLQDVLQSTASLNRNSTHPLAVAVINYAKRKNIKLVEFDHFKNLSGQGVVGSFKSQNIAFGNEALMQTNNIVLNPAVIKQVSVEQDLGATVSYVAIAGKLAAYVCFSDGIKPSSPKAIKKLVDSGLEVIMMTGDNQKTAKQVSKQLTLSAFYAHCLPEDKLNKIKKLQAQGNIVAMAGDGINDAPALAQANVGIAMGAGTDIAIESANITLVNGDLQGIIKAKRLSAQVMTNIKQNLFFAFIYNILGVPIAAGILFPFFGILLSPMLAAVAMSLSSVSVIANSLTLKNKK